MSALPPSLVDDTLRWIGQRQAAMLTHTIALAQINSGSLNVAGVQAVRQRLADVFGDLCGAADELPVAPWEQMDQEGRLVHRPLGEALRIRKPPQTPLLAEAGTRKGSGNFALAATGLPQST